MYVSSVCADAKLTSLYLHTRSSLSPPLLSLAQHHAELQGTQYGSGTWDWEVGIEVHTHKALRPEAFEGEPASRRGTPGITKRDVRFAYLVEYFVTKMLEKAKPEAGAKQ